MTWKEIGPMYRESVAVKGRRWAVRPNEVRSACAWREPGQTPRIFLNRPSAGVDKRLNQV
jgi:hypothetical protein